MKAVLIVVPIVLIAAVAGLGFAGVVKIPGITPAKKAAKKQAPTTGDPGKSEGKPQQTAATPAPPATETPKKTSSAPPPDVKVAKNQPKTDPDQGDEALAEVWNKVETPELIQITADWKDADLGRVLQHMDTGKVAKYIDTMALGDPDSHLKANPVRASKLSKILRDQGSIVKTADAQAS